MSADPGPPTISVTIVLHNSAGDLRECLRAIRPEIEEGSAELIAVDNASPDESAALVAEELPSAQLIRAEENLGFAAGANLAWPHARGRYWVLLNPDVVMPPRGLHGLGEWMDRHPGVGIGSAEIAAMDGSLNGSTGRAFPSLGRVLLELSRVHKLLPRETRARVMRGPYWMGGDHVDAGWVPGTAMIARRAAVEEAGLLDESFFLYGEDIEWCWRMRKSGWSVGVCSSVTARHRERASAVATFTEAETSSRGARGVLRAAEVTRGRRYARLWGRAIALAFALEARHPRRSPEHKTHSLEQAHVWRDALRTKSE